MSEEKDNLSEDQKRRAKRDYERKRSHAERLKDDPEQANKIIGKAAAKARRNRGKLAGIWEQLQLTIRLLRAWFRRDYRRIPTGTLLALLGAIIYLASPIDAIPDWIPFVGLLDDAFILSLVFGQFGNDLDQFREWEKSGGD